MLILLKGDVCALTAGCQCQLTNILVSVTKKAKITEVCPAVHYGCNKLF